MARLEPNERDALKRFADQETLRKVPPAALPAMDFLRCISNLPDSLKSPKPVRFQGCRWRL